MADTTTDFDRLDQLIRSQGVDALLQELAVRLQSEKKYHELFEALKMQARRSLGLPLLYNDMGEDLPADQRARLEEGLLNACREVGLLLLREGRIREGWMYMRPVGDKAAAAAELAKIETNDDNVEELVEVALHEGVDPGRGFQLVLQHYGTCNAITTFESAVARHPQRAQQVAAGLLVEHVHKELSNSLRADIARQEGQEPKETTLAGLVADRPWLFSDFSYHIDTTHLAATVRFARLLENPEHLRLALDMTEYGRRLSSQFQYKGDEPFLDIYPSHALYLSALLGEKLDEALAYFRDKAETLAVAEHGTIPIETYAHLLARLGRPREALDVLLKMIPDEARPMGFNSLLLELCQQSHDFAPYLEYCRSHQDMLGYVTGLAAKKEKD